MVIADDELENGIADDEFVLNLHALSHNSHDLTGVNLFRYY